MMMTDKAIRCEAKEKKFRANFREDFEDEKILKMPLNCTICGVPMKHQLITSGNLHPFLGVLVCDACNETCRTTLSIGPNRVPSVNYVFCLWCTVNYFTQKAEEFNFDSIKKRRFAARSWKTYFWKCKCLRQFCEECIEKHAPETMPKKNGEWWICFQCNSQPLWSLRALADVVLSYNEQSRQTKKDGTNCIICFESPIQMAFYPCGHLCLCVTCGSMYQKNHAKCPKCRQEYQDIMRIYPE